MVGEWSAQWIWSEERTAADTWMCFRKEVEIRHSPLLARARIAVDSRYWLWVDGTPVITEGGLNRGPYPGAGYHDLVDLTDYLHPGRNTLAILVWYWGNEGRNSVDSGSGGMVFQLEEDGESAGRVLLSSDGMWKTKRHPAFVAADPPHPSYLYAGHNITFDADKDMPEWIRPGFDDEDWDWAEEHGSPPCAPWGTLMPRPIPMFRDYGTMPYPEVMTGRETGRTIVHAHLPHAAHVSPSMTLSARKAGLRVDVRTDRYEVNGGPGDEQHAYRSPRIEYRTKVGWQEFICPTGLFGGTVVHDLPDGVDLLDLRYRETGYDVDFGGEFHCSDGFLERLYEKCRRTLYVCMRDNYMDCPDRERGQWIGDVSSQVPQTFYALGRASDDLTRKAIRDFFFWRSGDVLRGNVPGAHAAELPAQSLNAISELGMVMMFHLHNGDAELLRDGYPACRDYLALWSMDSDGLVAPRKGDWYWFDHGPGVDARVLENAWYYSALKAAIEMAGMTGFKQDIPGFHQRMKSIEMNFERVFWDGLGYRADVRYDDRANAMAVLSGLAGPDKWPFILRILREVRNSTPYMEGYVLESLYRMGCPDDAMKRMKLRYAPLVDNDDTTLWEDFSVLGTRNHAWSGAPLMLLARYVAGIAPTSPGYATYEILPHLGDLTSLSIVVPSVKGAIRVEMKRNETGFCIEVDSPTGTLATVGIPVEALQDTGTKPRTIIEFNGKSVPVAGRAAEQRKGFERFVVSPGHWKFHRSDEMEGQENEHPR